MKTFNEFCAEAYQLNEFQIGNPLNNPIVNKVARKIKPVFKNLERIENIVGASGIDKSRPQDLPTRAANLYGIVRPFSLPAMAPELIRQGESGSLTDRVARRIPGMTPNPKTDIGRKLGDVFSSVVNQSIQRRRQNPLPTSGLMRSYR